MKNIFVHHVLFWLKEPSDLNVRARFEKSLLDLTGIPEIQEYHIGVPAETRRSVIDGSYTYSLFTVFRNKEDQDIYQDHPMHLKFLEECEDLWERILVYDSVDVKK